jgi:hypothetical protein
MPFQLSVLVFCLRLLLYICYPAILLGNGVGWVLESLGIENATPAVVHIAVVFWLVFLVALAFRMC